MRADTQKTQTHSADTGMQTNDALTLTDTGARGYTRQAHTIRHIQMNSTIRTIRT